MISTDRLRDLHRQAQQVLLRSGSAPEQVQERLREDVEILAELIRRREGACE